MRPGDLVKVKRDCERMPFGLGCHCFWCRHDSNRIGLILNLPTAMQCLPKTHKKNAQKLFAHLLAVLCFGFGQNSMPMGKI